MGKAVLISIQPQWCELIASGKKTIEVRKTKPNTNTPFPVYIYQTKKTWVYNIFSKIADWQGKVIGEFICDEISEHNWLGYRGDYGVDKDFLSKTCLDYKDMREYGKGKTLYAWHISNLVIYDKPKELNEFRGNPCNAVLDIHESCTNCGKCGLKRPPQSWCFVEELR